MYSSKIVTMYWLVYLNEKVEKDLLKVEGERRL